MSPGRPLPPPPSGAARAPLGVIVALTGGLALVVAAAVVAVVLSAMGTPAGSETPEDALRAYLTADQGRDCEELVKHPITGYGDLEECEEGIAEELADYHDDDIDPDSFTYSIDSLEVSQESDDLARVTIDLFVSYERRGEEQTSGGYRGYEVVRDDGHWVVSDLAYED